MNKHIIGLVRHELLHMIISQYDVVGVFDKYGHGRSFDLIGKVVYGNAFSYSYNQYPLSIGKINTDWKKDILRFVWPQIQKGWDDLEYVE
jgi:hypothetical protein